MSRAPLSPNFGDRSSVEGDCDGRCVYLEAACRSEMSERVHDSFVQALRYGSLRDVNEVLDHFCLVDDGEMDKDVAMYPGNEFRLFVAQHNWPDPVVAARFADFVGEFFTWRHDASRCRRELAGGTSGKSTNDVEARFEQIDLALMETRALLERWLELRGGVSGGGPPSS